MPPTTRTLFLDSNDQTLELSRYSLQLADSDSPPTFFESRRITIGSSTSNDFVIKDPSVSRTHAEIVAEDGSFKLHDLNSKNGTFVAGHRIDALWINDTTHIRFGIVTLIFHPTEEKVAVHISGKNQFGNLLGTSVAMREIFGLLERVAPTDATILIEGESGTGKELAAEAIHNHSKRRQGPLIVVDCSAISHQLIESELFGHVKGAFTGAVSNRDGAFAAASGGTLFLDELGELPKDLQPKLLRALEKKEIKPVGTNKTVKVDVRIVAATNRKLLDEVEEGNFREDLYYRFAVIHLRLPPLRERPEDIPLLTNSFLERSKEMAGRQHVEIGYATMEHLKHHDWPGNVRELRNFIDRAVLLTQGNEIETTYINATGITNRPTPPPSETSLLDALNAAEQGISFKDAKDKLLHNFEITYWTTLLRQTNGNVSEVARIADVHRKTVEYNLKKLNLSRDDILS